MFPNELIVKLKQRDESAISAFISSYEQYVGSICFGFVRNQLDAEEIVQDVFVDAVKSIDTFREESQLSTWLYKIAVNRSLLFLRAQKRKKRTAQLFSLFQLQEKGEDIADREKLPDEHLIQYEKEEKLKQALNTLPQRQKIAFVLRYSNDLSYEEIGKIMDGSVKTVSALLQRAKEKLRTVM